jgi:hypothetical protein
MADKGAERALIFVRLCNFLLAWTAIIFIALFAALFLYGIAILVFRNAYGLELPSPFNLLPLNWREKLPFYR